MKATLFGKALSVEHVVNNLLPLPLYLSKVSAGFPSPAQDYIEQTIDLNALCIKHPASTFFVKVEGDSMIDAGIFAGDILVVDRSLTARHLDIVIAGINNEFTVKVLSLKPPIQLIPRNANYPVITLKDSDELNIFGVVTRVIRSLREN